MTRPQHKPAIDSSAVLGKAAQRAATRMGLSLTELGHVIGRDRTSIARSGIDPDSKSGELAKLLVRCFRSLAVMVDDNDEQIREWLNTPNSHTGGTPAAQLQTVEGLVTVCGYLDAIRGKV